MTKNNSFKLVFKNQENREVDLKYRLADSIVAEKWFKKIKHLKNIPIDNNESNLSDFTNLTDIYKDFCTFAGINEISLKIINQKKLNQLHELYEKFHSLLSKKKDNSILYKFHHAIHHYESTSHEKNRIYVGWGVKEGPLTESFQCNPYYSGKLQKNNIYLPWAELGKTPFTYWENKEPSNQKRFNELSKPHITLRARFMIPLQNQTPKKLNSKFLNWFKKYKNKWLKQYEVEKWDEIDEFSAPLLAIAEHKENLNHLNYDRIIT